MCVILFPSSYRKSVTFNRLAFRVIKAAEYVSVKLFTNVLLKLPAIVWKTKLSLSHWSTQMFVRK